MVVISMEPEGQVVENLLNYRLLTDSGKTITRSLSSLQDLQMKLASPKLLII
jgi:hypothetical protein